MAEIDLEALAARVSDRQNEWPTGEMLIRSMNARASLTGRVMDDPLFGMPYPADYWERIARYQRGDAIASGEHEVNG